MLKIITIIIVYVYQSDDLCFDWLKWVYSSYLKQSYDIEHGFEILSKSWHIIHTTLFAIFCNRKG